MIFGLGIAGLSSALASRPDPFRFSPCGSLEVPAIWFLRGLTPPYHAHAGHTRRRPGRV